MNSTMEATSDTALMRRAFIGAAIAFVVVIVIFSVAAETQLRFVFWLRQQQRAAGQGGTTELETITATPPPMRSTPPANHVTSLIHPRLRIQLDSTVKAAKCKRFLVKCVFLGMGQLNTACVALSCWLAYKGYAFGHTGTGALLCLSLGSLFVYEPSMPRQTRATFGPFVATAGFIIGTCAGISAFAALSPESPGSSTHPIADYPQLAQFNYMLALLMMLWAAIFSCHGLNTQRTLFVTKLPLSGTVDDLIKEQKRAIGTKLSCATPQAYYLEGSRFYAMPIRVACDHLWTSFQIASMVAGFVTVMFVAIMLAQLQDVPENAGPEYVAQLDLLTDGLLLGSLLPMGLTFLVLNPLVFTRLVRQWINRRLVAVGTSSPEARRAFATNLMMGEEEADVVIERAKRTFRGIPIRELSPGIFTATSSEAELYPKTRPLELGACDAFVSHSWHDDWTLKYKALEEWEADCVAPSGGQDVVVWWDRACIQVEQSQLSQALSCLPIYVSGCRRMVVLAGPSFPERLWCAMELFMFSELGGGLSCIDVRPFQTPSSGRTTIADSFHSFEVANTHCASALDKDYFVSIIEAAFGGEDPFNAIVRGILTDSKH